MSVVKEKKIRKRCKMSDFWKLFSQFYNSQLSLCHQLVPVKNGDRWYIDKRQKNQNAVPFCWDPRKVRHDIFQHLHHFKQLPQAMCISSLIPYRHQWSCVMDRSDDFRQEREMMMNDSKSLLFSNTESSLSSINEPEYDGSNPLSHLCQILVSSDTL